MSNCKIYLISPPKINNSIIFRDLLDQILSFKIIECFQLRIKDELDEEILKLIKILHPICKKNNKPLIINDKPTIVKETKCEGVHIGPLDTPYKEARNIVGKNAIVGVTCKGSRHAAIEAAEKGADYVAFGSFYNSPTKNDTELINTDILEIWNTTTTVPCVAIGGINLENCMPLIKAGADFLAISSGIWSFSEGPIRAIELFEEKLLKNNFK